MSADFNFPKPASSGGTSLFGQPATSSANNTTTSTTNLFGQTTQNTNPGAGGAAGGGQSLFGGAGNNTSTKPSSFLESFGKQNQGGGTSLFGNNSGGSSSGGLFGGANKTEEKKEGSSSFGFTTPNKAEPSNPPGTASFGKVTGAGQQTASAASGSSTPPSSKPAFSFGGPSTTPAGPPPSGNLFGGLGQSQKSTSNLFGGLQTSASTSGQSTPKPASTLFGGVTSQTPATSQAGSGNLFGSTAAPASGAGASPSLFVTPTASNQEGQKEAPKFSFPPQQAGGGSGAETPKSDVQATSKPSFSFPSSASSAQSSQPTPSSNAEDKPNPFAAASSSAATASSLFGGPSQQKTAQESPAPSASNLFGTPSQKRDDDGKSSKPSALFGAIGANKDKDETAASNLEAAKPSSTGAGTGSTPTTTATTAPSVSLFGGAAKANQESQAASKPTDAGDATTNLGASTAGPAPTPQSRLKNKSMDEIITRWASDLSKYQKAFQAQAEKVALWDRMLLENGNAISKLYAKTFQAERDTVEVQKQLSAVESNQDELSEWLDRYEREVDELMARQVGQGEGLQGPDQERERTYKIAERVSERLDDMGKDLTSIIEEINDTSAKMSKTSKPDDPLSQIVRILNGHLSQLQLIDQGAAELQAKVNTAQRESSRLGTRGNGAFANEAVDHFYKSYMRQGQ